MTTENSSIPENEKNTVITEHDEVNQDANTKIGESSTPDETDAKEPESLLDAVTAALAPDEESKDEESSTSTEIEKTESELDPESDSSEQNDDNDSDQPEFHKHPRWQKMLTENRELKEKTKEFELVSEKAQNMDAFNNAVNESGLTPQEFNEGFEIMQAMKHDPVKALELLAPHFKGLQEFSGQRLPSDLQEKVDAGQVDAETAAELAAARNQKHFANERVTATEQSLKVQREADAARVQQETVATIKTAISDWETKWKGTDPDYSIKQPMVHDRVSALIVERGAPANAQAAIEMSNEAKKQVDDMLSKVLPAKRSIKHVPSGGSVTTTTEPKTLKEAIQLAATR